MNPEPTKPPAKILDGAAQQHRPTGEDFRVLKATLTAGEFGAVQWAAKRAGENHKAVPLAEFMRGTLIERVREVVRGEIARGKAIPPDIAAVLADCHRAK